MVHVSHPYNAVGKTTVSRTLNTRIALPKYQKFRWIIVKVGTMRVVIK